MHDPSTRALITRPDLAAALAAPAAPAVAGFLDRHPLAAVLAALADPAAQAALANAIATRAGQ